MFYQRDVEARAKDQGVNLQDDDMGTWAGGFYDLFSPYLEPDNDYIMSKVLNYRICLSLVALLIMIRSSVVSQFLASINDYLYCEHLKKSIQSIYRFTRRRINE